MSFLAQEAHARGLSIGIKNASSLASQIEPFTDFAIVEECHEYGECSAYGSYTDAGKAVFSVEYERSCSTEPRGFSNITCNLDLTSQCTLCS